MSSNDLAKVKDVKNETKGAIFGYVRQMIQPLFPDDNVYYIIPTLVIHWILLYYYIGERFDENYCNRYYKLSDDKMIITKSKDGHLSEIIECGVRKWKFKILKLNTGGWNMCIGVWRTRYPMNTSVGMYNSGIKGMEYGWIVNYDIKTWGDDTQKKQKYIGQDPCVTGDTIEMKLDLNKRELSYSRNEGEFIIAFNKIEKTSYRGVVSIYMKDDAIQLL